MGRVFKNLPTDEKNEIYTGAIHAQVTTPDGEPCPGASYELELSDGTKRVGQTDSTGTLLEGSIKPGVTGTLTLPGMPLIGKAD